MATLSTLVSGTSLVLITGADVGLLKRKRSELVQHLESAGLMEESESFSGQGDPNLWISAACTLPFFAERRVVFVDHALSIDKKKLEAAQWKNLPNSGLLVLIAGVDSSEYDKVQAFKSQSQALIKIIERAGGKVISTDIEPSRLGKELQDFAFSKGKKLTSRASELLVEMTGSSYGESLDELEKLVTYVGSANEIREADVEAIVIPCREWNVFHLVDGITQGNPAKAMKQLKSLIATPGSLADNAFRALFPMISRQISLLWQAKIGLEFKVNWGQPSPEFLAKLPDRPKITEVKGYRLNTFLDSARRIQYSQLTKSFELLANADSELKGALPSYSVTESLERLVIEMAEAFMVRKSPQKTF